MNYKDLIVKRTMGKIESLDIELARGCILSASVWFDFGGSGQCFGGYCFDEPAPKDENGISQGERIGGAAGADWIRRLLRVFNVEKLQSIKGKAAWACYESSSWNDSIKGIEPLDFEDPKMCPAFYIAEWRNFWFPEGKS
jgi:hypothetical protein